MNVPVVGTFVVMAPKPRLSVDGVVGSAVELVDRDGYDALSLSAVAGELSVAPSALYTYCNGLDGLRNMVAVAATNNLTGRLRNAAIGNAGEAALTAMSDAYRGFALDHPGQFASTLRPPEVGNDDFAAASTSLLDIFVLVYLAMGLDDDRSRLAARSTHSALHGFLAIEHTSGTTPEHSDEYRHLVELLRSGLVRPSS